MTTTEFGGGGVVGFPNILISNEKKNKIVRIMKPGRRRA
jgi:hypothetical protein